MISPGNISFSDSPGAPAGFINVAGARNGLTVDSTNHIVLGADALNTGEQLLSNRFIDMRQFAITFQSSTNSNTSGVNFQVQSVAFNDMPGAGFNGQVIAQPAGNITLVGLPGQTLTQLGASATYNFSNAAGSGNQNDFGSASVFGPSAGSISFHAFADFGGAAMTGGSGDYVSFFSEPVVQAALPATGKTRGFHFKPQFPVGIPAADTLLAIETTFGNVLLCSDDSDAAVNGHVGIRLGAGVMPTAKLHLGPGKANAGSALLKFEPGAILAANEDGAWEYDGSRLFFTYAGGDRESILTGQVGGTPALHPAVVQTQFFGVDGTKYLAEPAGFMTVKISGSDVLVPFY
jgi:hypothetical protein